MCVCACGGGRIAWRVFSCSVDRQLTDFACCFAPLQENRGLSTSKMASPRSAPPDPHLRAGPRTPKSQTKRTFSSEPSMSRTQSVFNVGCSAIPAAPLGHSDAFTCSDPSEKSVRVSRNKALARADASVSLGPESPRNSVHPNSLNHVLRFNETRTRQQLQPWNLRSPDLQHPCMAEIGQEGAELFLRDRPVGAFVFRPGTRQWMFLSWKTGDRTFEHSKITFIFSKTHKVPPKLHLQREVYKDLYEIESHYMTPLAKYVRALCTHPNFFAANNIQEVFKMLLERQELHTVFENQQPYIIAPFSRRPGPYCHSFIVVVIRDYEPVKVRFQVTPNGYFVLGRRCTSPNMIIHCLMEIYTKM